MNDMHAYRQKSFQKNTYPLLKLVLLAIFLGWKPTTIIYSFTIFGTFGPLSIITVQYTWFSSIKCDRIIKGKIE